MKKLTNNQTRKAILAAISVSMTLALSAVPTIAGGASNGLAMTWKTYKVPQGAGTRVGCFNVCDAYKGDTSIKESHPILCFVPGTTPTPAAYQAYAVAQGQSNWQFYLGWSKGEVGLTKPYFGYDITSRADGDKKCKEALRSSNARMAEHHDNGTGGWSLGANIHSNSQTPALLKRQSKRKFWTAINGQNANTW